MLTLGDVLVLFKSDDSQVNTTMDRLEAKAEGWSSRVGGLLSGAFSVALGGLVQRGFESLTATIGGSMIGMNASLETATSQFTTMMGSADLAQQHVKDLFQFAGATPFETGPIIAASRHMQTFGGFALNTKANLTLLGDATAGVSGDFERVGYWSGRAYDAIQNGRPFGDAAGELQQMGILSGVARNKMEDLQKAGASSGEIWKVFTNDIGRFNGAMADQANLWDGLTSTFSDAMNLLGAQAFAPVFELLKDGLREVNAMLASDQVQQWAADFAAGLSQVTGLIGSFFGALQTGSLDDFGARLTAMVGPEVANAITSVIGAFQTLQSTVGQVWSAVEPLFSGIVSSALGWGQNVIIQFANGIGSAAGYVSSALSDIGDMVTYWLVPHSPPKLLPNLDQWGADALTVYMNGWKDGDFSVFGDLSKAIEGQLKGMVDSGKLGEGELVPMLLGSRQGIAQAIEELRTTGTVAETTFAQIRAAGGDAGPTIEGIARAFLSVEAASQKVAQARGAVTAADAAIVAAQASGDQQLVNIARRKAQDARQRLTAAQSEQQKASTLLDRQKQIANVQRDQTQLLQRQVDLMEKLAKAGGSGGGGGSKTANEADKARKAQDAYAFSAMSTAEKIAYLQQKQQGLTETDEDYWKIKGQLGQLVEQQNKDAERDSKKAEADKKKLTDAEWAYNYGIADTAGKLQMQREKLAGLTEDQEEYWRVKATIAQLDEQLEKEQEAKDKKKGGGAGGAKPSGGGIAMPKPPGGGGGAAAIQNPIAGLVATWTGEATAGAQRVVDGLRDKLVEGLAQLPAMLYTAAANVGVGVIEAIGNQAPALIAKLETWHIAFLDWLVLNMPAWAIAFGTNLARVYDAIGLALPGLVAALGHWAAALIDWVIQTMPGLFRELLALNAAVIGWIAERAPGIAAQLAAWAGAFILWVVETAPKLIVALGTMLGDLILWIITNAPAIRTQLEDWAKAFWSWIGETAAPGVLTALGDLWTKFSGWISEKARVLSADGSIGSALVDGIRAGLSAAWGAFTAWLQTKINEIPKVVRDALGIRSPARKMIPLGGHTVEGMRVGAEAQFPKLMQSFRGMAGDVAAMEWASPGLNLPGGRLGAFASSSVGAAGRSGLREDLTGLRDEIARLAAMAGITVNVDKVTSDMDLEQLAYKLLRIIQRKQG